MTLLWGGALTQTVEGTVAFVLAVPVLTFIAIVLHELGHAVAAKAVGARVVALSFGSGLHTKVVRYRQRFYMFGLRPQEGMTLIADVPRAGFRWRRITISAGGPVVNLLLAAGAWYAWGTTEFTSPIVDALVFFWAFINTLMGLMNLYPTESATQLGTTASDGRQILSHFAMADEDIDELVKLMPIGEAYFEWLYGEPERAAELLADALAEKPVDPAIAATGSAVLLDLKRCGEGISICERALEQELDVEARALIENNLACLLLKLDVDPDLPRIDKLTKSAMDLLPMLLAVRATTGAYCVRAGEFARAVDLLNDKRFILESKKTQSHVACELALAFAGLGNLDDARESFERAKSLFPENEELSAVERELQQAT